MAGSSSRCTGFAAALASGVWIAGASPPAHADVSDALLGLYGGDGITLDRTFSAGHTAHFSGSGITELAELSSAISAASNLSPPTSGVNAFTFDLDEAVFVRSTQSLGPLLAERAQTVGRNKVNFGLSFSSQEFKVFNGEDLNSLQRVFLHDDDCASGADRPEGCPGQPPNPGFPAFEFENIIVDLDLKLSQDVFRFFVNYGITERWDVGFMLPIAHTKLSVRSVARVDSSANPSTAPADTNKHHFCDEPGLPPCLPSEDPSTDQGSEESGGIGDVLLRTKYHFADDQQYIPDLAVLGQIKLNTGNEDDFQGTGEVDFGGWMIASKEVSLFTPHTNLGLEASTGPAASDSFRYVLGTDVRVFQRLTLAADVFGRVPRSGDPTVDIGVGGKVNPFGTVVLFWNTSFPLNRQNGLRPDVLWTIGADVSF